MNSTPIAATVDANDDDGIGYLNNHLYCLYGSHITNIKLTKHPIILINQAQRNGHAIYGHI